MLLLVTATALAERDEATPVVNKGLHLVLAALIEARDLHVVDTGCQLRRNRDHPARQLSTARVPYGTPPARRRVRAGAGRSTWPGPRSRTARGGGAGPHNPPPPD